MLIVVFAFLMLVSVLVSFNLTFRAEGSLRPPGGQPSLSPHNSDHQSLIVSFVPLVFHSLEPYVGLFVKCLTASKKIF